MKHLLIAGIVFCSGANLFSQTITFTYKGKSRSCTVHLPPSYNSSNSYPLVFNLHGRTSNAMAQEAYSGMDGVADTAGFIVAYPNAISGIWDVIFSNSPIDDVGFISTLLDSLIGRYHIDTTRVYATGMSMGGFMTYRLGCELADRLAAIASVSGPTTDSVLIACGSSRIIPVMHIHGTADNTVPYEGTTLYNHVDSTIQFFVGKNGCPSPVVYDFPNTNTIDSCTVTSYYYCMGEDSAEVLFYKVIGGGHTWPGGIAFPPLGNTNQDIKASMEIWKFFSKHPPKSNPAGIMIPPQNSSLRVFPNPAKDVLHVVLPEGISRKKQIMVYDMTGKSLRSVQVSNENSVAVDLHGLPEGLYAVLINTDRKTLHTIFSIK